MGFRIWLACLLTLAAWRPADAHEVRPGYLEVRATAADRYQVVWKQPALGEMRLRIDPVFPTGCTLVGERIRQLVQGAYLDRMTLRCEGALAGKAVGVAGLEATLTDVLARLQLADGRVRTEILKPSRPSFVVSGSAVRKRGDILMLLVEGHWLVGRPEPDRRRRAWRVQRGGAAAVGVSRELLSAGVMMATIIPALVLSLRVTWGGVAVRVVGSWIGAVGL
jgi:hypothetical protein